MNTLFRRGPRRLRFSLLTVIVGWFCLAPFIAADQIAPGSLGVGATFETLQVGTAITYRQVKVRSVNARTLMISHSGGLASVPLRDLSPALQTAFGYDSANAAAADAVLKKAQAEGDLKRAKDAAAKRRASQMPAFEVLLQSFGKRPALNPVVDLRPEFSHLSLDVKNQGARPSCAIFAIISALEFQNAKLTGTTEKFSEEYLIWATCKTLQRAPLPLSESAPTVDADPENFDGADAGFALSEVVTALRAYGIPSQESLPYKGGRTDPSPEVIDVARNYRRVSVISLPGRDQPTRIANLIHTLNAGVPVAVGLAWPSGRASLSAMLDAQKVPGDRGHAVTIVGYENKSGSIADTVFFFKNSWGVRWGDGGYGQATYRYLLNNLAETALLDIASPTAQPVRR